MLGKKGVLGFVWAFLESFSAQIVSFLFSVAMARILIPEDYGVFAIAQVITQISLAISQGGLLQSLIRRHKISTVESSSVFWFAELVGLGLYLLILLFRNILGSYFESETLAGILPLTGLILFISPLTLVPLAKLTKDLNFKRSFILQLPSLIISGGIALYLAYMDFGVYALILQTILNKFLYALLMAYNMRWVPRLRLSSLYLSYHVAFAYKLMLSGLIHAFTSNIYSIIIGKFYQLDLLGYYNRADNLKRLPVQNIFTAVNKVSFPLFVQVKHDKGRQSELFYKISRVLLMGLAFVLGMFFLNAEVIIRVALGDQWLQSVPLFKYLLFTGFFYPLNALILSLLNVQGRSDLFLKLEVVKNVLVLLGALLVARFGVMKLVMFQVLFSFCAVSINAFYTDRLGLTQTRKIYVNLVRYVVVAVAMLLCIDYTLNHFGVWVNAIIKSLVYLASYSAYTFFFNRSTVDELRELLKRKRA